jgi:hypothetical protein
MQSNLTILLQKYQHSSFYGFNQSNALSDPDIRKCVIPQTEGVASVQVSV